MILTDHNVVATDSSLDITNQAAVLEWVDHFKPEYIINCAAYTNVDGAEDDVDRAWDVNVNGAANIAVASRQNPNTMVVHVSTDYVFDGAKTCYTESDFIHANPLNHYGFTKWNGDMKFCSLAQWCFIVRTSWLFSETGNNFVKTMLNLFRTKDEVRVVNDQLGRPTYAPYLAEIACRLLFDDTGEDPPSGSWNVANAGIASWHQFAVEIYKVARELEMLDREVNIIPVTTKEMPRKAVRPKFSVLDTKRVEGHLGGPLKSWKQSVRDCLRKLKLLESK